MTAARALATSPKTFAERDHWMRAVLAADLPHVAVRVAVRIALHLHVDSGRCHPGYDALASELGMSKRSIIRIVAMLQRTGWIEVARRGHHQPNQFCLLRGDRALSPLARRSEVTNSNVRGDKSGHSEVTHAVTHKAKRTAKRKEGRDSLSPGAVASRSSPRKKSSPDTGDSFERFWAIYPRRVGRDAAVRAFAAALDRGADPEAVIAGARRYAGERAGQEPRYTKHPTTWLNGGHWQDEPPPGVVIDQHGNVVAVEERPRYRERGAIEMGQELIAECEAAGGFPW